MPQTAAVTQWTRGGGPDAQQRGRPQVAAEEGWKAWINVEEEAEEKNIRVVGKRATQWKTGGGFHFSSIFR